MKRLFCGVLSFIISHLMLFSPASPDGSLPVWGGFGRNDEVYSCANIDEKIIALSFDDGPHPKYTGEILDILSEYGIKATFFVIGQNAEYYPDVVKRVSSEGHEIGNHTYSHIVPDKKTTPELLVSELKKTDSIIKKLTGKSPVLFRPPTGYCCKCTVSAASEMDYKIIVWTVDTRDWAHTPTEKIISTVKNEVRSGSIILMHDFISHYSPTPAALRKLIPWLISEGYDFVTVSELLEMEN